MFPGVPWERLACARDREIALRAGCRSFFEGKSSHAAAPEDGVSPGACDGRIDDLSCLNSAVAPLVKRTFSLATLTHAKLGEPTFGIAPADGELRVTLRSMTNETDGCADERSSWKRSQRYAGRSGLLICYWHDVFRAVVNDMRRPPSIARGAAEHVGTNKASRCPEADALVRGFRAVRRRWFQIRLALYWGRQRSSPASQSGL